MKRIEKLETEKKELLKNIRTAVANYMRSEGCSCCQDIKNHKKHEKILAKLLDVPAYDDNSGYNFNEFISKGR